jgi:hypothetical protein
MAITAFGRKDEIAAVPLIDAFQEGDGCCAERADGLAGLAAREPEKSLLEMQPPIRPKAQVFVRR